MNSLLLGLYGPVAILGPSKPFSGFFAELLKLSVGVGIAPQEVGQSSYLAVRPLTLLSNLLPCSQAVQTQCIDGRRLATSAAYNVHKLSLYVHVLVHAHAYLDSLNVLQRI